MRSYFTEGNSYGNTVYCSDCIYSVSWASGFYDGENRDMQEHSCSDHHPRTTKPFWANNPTEETP